MEVCCKITEQSNVTPVIIVEFGSSSGRKNFEHSGVNFVELCSTIIGTGSVFLQYDTFWQKVVE